MLPRQIVQGKQAGGLRRQLGQIVIELQEHIRDFLHSARAIAQFQKRSGQRTQLDDLDGPVRGFAIGDDDGAARHVAGRLLVAEAVDDGLVVRGEMDEGDAGGKDGDGLELERGGRRFWPAIIFVSDLQFILEQRGDGKQFWIVTAGGVAGSHEGEEVLAELSASVVRGV